jgi:hypothetical protein
VRAEDAAAAAAPHASSGTSEDHLSRRPTRYKSCTFCTYRGNYERVKNVLNIFLHCNVT